MEVLSEFPLNEGHAIDLPLTLLHDGLEGTMAFTIAVSRAEPDGKARAWLSYTQPNAADFRLVRKHIAIKGQPAALMKYPKNR